jgi:hypothetical protein
MMQYDVKQGHLDQSGYYVKYPVRVKGVSFTGTASAGYLVLFDTLSTPVSASVTYGRSGTTVTVSKTAHGLSTGNVIGIHFENGTGGAATDGTYTVTKLTADTFTITDINSGSITGTPAAVYTVGRWLMTFQSTAGDTYNNVPFIPGEGVRAENGVYAYMSNVDAAQIFYG